MSVFYMPPVDEPCTRGPHMRFKKMVQLGKYASPSHLAHKPSLYMLISPNFYFLFQISLRRYCSFSLRYYRMLSIVYSDVICQVVVAIV